MLPFKVVEHPSFRSMINQLDPRMPPISRRTLVRVVETGVEELKNEIMDEISNMRDQPAFTLDFWTSLQSKPMAVMSMHYVDDKWKCREKFIALSQFTGAHTGDRVY